MLTLLALFWLTGRAKFVGAQETAAVRFFVAQIPTDGPAFRNTLAGYEGLGQVASDDDSIFITPWTGTCAQL